MFLLFRISIIILTPLALRPKTCTSEVVLEMKFPRGSNKSGTHLRNSSLSGNEKWNKKVVATKHTLVFVHCWPIAIRICMTQKNSYSDQYLETILIICVFAQSSNKEQIMVIQQECHTLFYIRSLDSVVYWSIMC